MEVRLRPALQLAGRRSALHDGRTKGYTAHVTAAGMVQKSKLLVRRSEYGKLHFECNARFLAVLVEFRAIHRNSL